MQYVSVHALVTVDLDPLRRVVVHPRLVGPVVRPQPLDVALDRPVVDAVLVHRAGPEHREQRLVVHAVDPAAVAREHVADRGLVEQAL
jgi:hypothetical protein